MSFPFPLELIKPHDDGFAGPDVGALDHPKIDFHVAAESSVFFSSPGLLLLALFLTLTFAVAVLCLASIRTRVGLFCAPVHVEVPLPGGCCHLQSGLGTLGFLVACRTGRFFAVTRTRLQLDL